ncbi:MAG: DUF1559 domain-containing protein [Planctomycetota bacterium]
MMKAARRSRPKAAGEEEVAPKQKKPPKKAVAKEEIPPAPSGRAQRKTKVEEAPKAKPAGPVKVAITVEELKEKNKLSSEAKRKWAYDNLVAIGEAVDKYYEAKGYYFRRYSKRENGLVTLSWRVRLLPYLGYNELYRKFDFEKPWYMEPNKSLLKYIPKEYVSPERFDTKTNFQLPAHKLFMFGTEGAQRKSNVEDGLEETIMLVEVNDDMAVEWTAPLDFQPGRIDRLSEYLGEVRKDGTFAMWANGWPVLLAKSVTDKQLKAAFTAESGEIPVSGTIHRPISTGDVSSGAVAAKAKPKAVKSTPKAEPPPVVEQVIPREPAPIAGDIEKAMDRLRDVFATKLQQAKSDEKKRSLAKEMLKTANQMKAKPAEGYALSIAAQRIATDSGDAAITIDAVDLRVGLFEIDAYEENLKALGEFANGQKNPEFVKGRNEYTERAIRIIYAAIQENDFLRANKLARTASRYSKAGDSVTDLPKLFLKLQGHLGGAKASFEDAKEHLVSLRINPDDDDAAAGFGEFLCFIKGDWKTGLPMLTRSKNKTLAQIAQMDIDGPESVDEKIAVADSWWELSERGSGVYKQAAINRALLYYNQVYEGMPQSLDKMHVKNQLDSAKLIEPSSPIDICEKIAKSLGVNLEVNLAALASGKYRDDKQKRRDDDDD